MNSLTPQLALFGVGPTELLVIVGILVVLVSPIVLIVWLVVRRSSSESNVSRAASIAASAKKCPDCAEVVQADARVCKHCGFRFDAPVAKA